MKAMVLLIKTSFEIENVLRICVVRYCNRRSSVVMSYYNTNQRSAYNIMKRPIDNQPAGTPVKKPKAARQGVGRTGERLAAEELSRRGYRILEQNFRCTHGEIDLVAEDAQDLIFIEVKTRRGNAYGLPEEAVTTRKQQKIVQVASYYLDLHACSE